MLATTFSRSALRRQVHRSHAIGEGDLRRIAPSVFAQSAHESRSKRYTYIPTIEVLRGLFANGFQAFFAVQATTRAEGREGFTKHMLRLRHADSLAKGGADVNEVILINSHDGGSSYQMLAGVFRFVCANGLVCGNVMDDLRIKHSGDVRTEVIDGAFRVLRGFGEVEERKDAFKSMQLTQGEQLAYARAALAVRYPVIDTQGETVKEPPIEAAQLLSARRHEDTERSLWATFNTVQENAVQGGIRTRDRRRRAHTRGVNGIDGNVHLNRALWVLADELRKAKIAS